MCIRDRVSVCALLCGLAESVRTAGARCYLRMAADSAVDSLMAQYHRELWDRYRIDVYKRQSRDWPCWGPGQWSWEYIHL